MKRRVISPSSAPVAPTVDSKRISDGDLLGRFVHDRDEPAFEELVRRHGKLVFAVAIRVTRDRHAAEDVFQATFLVLAQKAKRLRQRDALAGWLHGVTLRVAKKALWRLHRLRTSEAVMEPVVRSNPFDNIGTAYDQQVLDEELHGLPQVYREPLVLHFLEGRTYEETAAALGISLGAVEGRLKRGKHELHLRLVRRGVALGTTLALLSWSQSAAQAAVSSELISHTAAGGLAVLKGTPFSAGCTSEAVHLAAKETVMASAGKIAIVSTGLMLAAAGGWVGSQGSAAGPGISRQPTADTVIGDQTPEAKATTVVLGNGATESPAAPPKDYLFVLKNGSDMEVRIADVLGQATSVEFPGNSLSDVMNYLSTVHDVPILVDRPRLNEEGLNGDEEVSLVLSRVTLKSALNQLLDNVNGVPLTYVVKDDVLLITTQQYADSYFETRVYDVRPLHVTSPEALANVIRSGTSGRWSPKFETDPKTNTTRELDVPYGQVSYINGSFVVRQTQKVHSEIEALLKNLHELIKYNPESPEWPAPPPAKSGGALGGMGGAGGGFF